MEHFRKAACLLSVGNHPSKSIRTQTGRGLAPQGRPPRDNSSRIDRGGTEGAFPQFAASARRSCILNPI